MSRAGHPPIPRASEIGDLDCYGDRGRHARAAVGMASLPIGIAVEIEMVVEVE